MLTVLMFSANPKGTTPLRMDEELREVKEALIKRAKLRDRFTLVSEHAVRTRDVHRALLDHQPHILHFSGHGAGAEGLILEDEIGGGKEVSGEAIAHLLAVFKDSLQCVILNACYSEVQAKAISEHIPFVIGMSDEIADKAAIEFSVAFYDAIGAGRDIRFAFELATVAIKMAGIDQDHVPILLSKQAESKLLTTSATIAFSTYNPETFTGREEETRVICEQIQRGCRVVAIVGMTGVGKTALAERAIAQLAEDENLPYVRFSLDDQSIGVEFVNGGAALLRELGDEPTLEDQQNPSNLLRHIVSRLQSHPCRLQIDSMERLLQGNEQDGWSEFCDPLWLSLFQRVLSAGQCGSQVILTTQDVPGELEAVGDRFRQLWHYQALQGLSEQEQVELFRKLGVQDNQERLKRIGEFYDGHPLVLQVIADEIKQRPFNGSVDAYWERYGEEFGGATPARVGDRSRTFRTRVRQRVEQAIESLPESAKQLLSACSVFHRPVPETFWIEMGEGDDRYSAFELIKGRNLAEYVDVPGQYSLIRLHNLIRSAAYELLKGDNEAWERAGRKAADLWLTAYVPPNDAPNIETVRGYLEAFDHFCEVGDWNAIDEVVWAQLELTTATEEYLCWQLGTWGYFHEQAQLFEKYLDITRQNGDREGESAAIGSLGTTYKNLGQYEQAIRSHQKHLFIAQEIGNRLEEAIALGNLGIAYKNLGQYEHAISFHQQALFVRQEIGDRIGEGISLGNLGIIYDQLGHYEQAIDFYQQSLAVSRNINDRQGEGTALGNLGLSYFNLGRNEEAIDLYQQHLVIARSIDDRLGESYALGNLGNVYASVHQYEQAIALYQQSLRITQEIGHRQGESISFTNLGNTYQNLKQYPKALVRSLEKIT